MTAVNVDILTFKTLIHSDTKC